MLLTFGDCTVERVEGNVWKATAAGDRCVSAEFRLAPDIDAEPRDDLEAIHAAALRALYGEDHD